jgi:hypothetical protein
MLQEGVALDEPGGPAEGAAELRLERFSIESLHPPILFLGLARITPTPTRPHRGAGVCFSGLPLMGISANLKVDPRRAMSISCGMDDDILAARGSPG